MKNTSMKTKKYLLRRGLALFDMLMYLIISMVILAATLGIYSLTSNTNQASDYEQELTMLVGVIDQVYGSQSDFSQITTQQVAQSGLLDNRYSSDKQTIVTTTKGQVQIQPYSINGGSNNAFQITFNTVPNKVCSALMTSAFGSNMLGHSVNGKDYGTSPAPASDLQTCTTGNNQNTLSWIYN